MKPAVPIMAKAFGPDWDNLPPVFKLHYANRPNCSDVMRAVGKMQVRTVWFLRWFAPFMRYLGLAPFCNSDEVPVIVNFASEMQGAGFWLKRHFAFEQPHDFSTRMLVMADGSVQEQMAAGVIWHLEFVWQDDQVQLRHRQFLLRVAGWKIGLPIWLAGRCDATETAIDDHRFYTRAVLSHWLFGELYEYAGTFRMEAGS